MLVRVYRNLHRGGYSVQHKTPKGWRVRGHVNYLYLTEVQFKVYESGRQRVIRTKQKDVHAFVIGQTSDDLLLNEVDVSDRISYNPYTGDYFYRCEDRSRVDSVKVAYLSPEGVFGR